MSRNIKNSLRFLNFAILIIFIVVTGLSGCSSSSSGNGSHSGGSINTITVSKSGTGSGIVLSSPSGISCGGICSASFASGTPITLTAAPVAGSIFAGWGGVCNSASGATIIGNTCSGPLNANVSVSAIFNTNPNAGNLNLTVVIPSGSGNGSGTVTSSTGGINCPSTTCTASISSGTQVTLTATPASGSYLAGWTGGGCSGTGSCVVTLSANTTVIATFANNPVTGNFNLTVIPAGNGSGNVSDGATLYCPATCIISYTNGTQVTLTPSPAVGANFYGWSGGGCSGTSTCVVTLSGNTTVTATFNPLNYLMTTTINPGGGVDLSTFGYDTITGIVPNALPSTTLNIPATSQGNGCYGSLYDVLGYDNTNHILFLRFKVQGTSMTICSYIMDMTFGALTFVQAHTENGNFKGGFIDTINMTAVWSGGGTPLVYTYNADGTFNTTTALTINGGVPNSYSGQEADFINNWIWYGTSPSSSNIYYGVCPFIYGASSGYTIGACTPLSNPITILDRGLDTTNGLMFGISQVSSSCSSTQTVASVYPYSTTTGVINPTPVTTNLGTCANSVWNPNHGGPSSNGFIDLTDQIFFSYTNTSSPVINPLTYTLNNSSFAFSTPPAPVTDSNLTFGSGLQPVSIDTVNHIVFVLTTPDGSTITGVDAYPYTNSGFTSTSPNSSTISPTNVTADNVDGYSLYAFIY